MAVKSLSSKRGAAVTGSFLILTFLVAGGLFYVYRHNTNKGQIQEPLTDTKAVVAASLSCAEKLGNQKIVGIQAGHYQIDQLPDEQANLRYDFGASAGGVNEVDINLDVAQKTIALLNRQGIDASLLPATLPEDYCASAFVAVHADGNDDASVYGYKVAPSSWDTDGQAQSLSDTIQQDYAQQTSMSLNPTITDNMTQYYAFNFEHFTHALNPQTPGVLIEVGFITNSIDRSMMTNYTEEMAQGIANGVMDFLHGKVVPTATPSAIIN